MTTVQHNRVPCNHNRAMVMYYQSRTSYTRDMWLNVLVCLVKWNNV